MTCGQRPPWPPTRSSPGSACATARSSTTGSPATADRLTIQLATCSPNWRRSERNAGRWAADLDSARRWVAIDSLSESAHREVMRLLRLEPANDPLRFGSTGSCVRDLDRELGVDAAPGNHGALRRHPSQPAAAS